MPSLFFHNTIKKVYRSITMDSSAVDREIDKLLKSVDEMSGISSLIQSPAYKQLIKPTAKPVPKLHGVEVGKKVMEPMSCRKMGSVFAVPKETRKGIATTISIRKLGGDGPCSTVDTKKTHQGVGALVKSPPRGNPMKSPTRGFQSVPMKSPNKGFQSPPRNQLNTIKSPTRGLQSVPMKSPNKGFQSVPMKSPTRGFQSPPKHQGQRPIKGGQLTHSPIKSPMRRPEPPVEQYPEYLQPAMFRSYVPMTIPKATPPPMIRPNPKSPHQHIGKRLTIKDIEREMKDMIRQNYEEIKTIQYNKIEIDVAFPRMIPMQHAIHPRSVRVSANRKTSSFPHWIDRYLLHYLLNTTPKVIVHTMKPLQ
jgi:hypothetical protein